MKIFKIINYIIESHYLIIGGAFFVGLFFSNYLLWATSYTKLILAIIFFLSSLKIDFGEVKNYLLNDKLFIFFLTLISLFILPFVVYYLTNLFYPSLAVAFLILASVSSGMTTPLLTEVVGGRYELALVLTVVTSLLSPVISPLVIKFFAGTSVSIDAMSMFLLLAEVIYIPFFIAQVLKKFYQPKIDKISFSFKIAAVILLGFLIAIIVARHSEVLINEFNFQYVILLFLFFILLHFVGYFVVFWRSRGEKIAVIICLAYMNFTLAIELVSEFFIEPNIILPVIFSVIPWALIFIPFKYFVKNDII